MIAPCATELVDHWLGRMRIRRHKFHAEIGNDEGIRQQPEGKYTKPGLRNRCSVREQHGAPIVLMRALQALSLTKRRAFGVRHSVLICQSRRQKQCFVWPHFMKSTQQQLSSLAHSGCAMAARSPSRQSARDRSDGRLPSTCELRSTYRHRRWA